MNALCILVVEDDPVIGMCLSETLEAMGHTVCAVERTEGGAVAAALRYQPNLMIVDSMLGQGSGIAAVAEILRSGFIAHLFITGDVRSVRAKVPHAIIVQKPFFEGELAAAIAAVKG